MPSSSDDHFISRIERDIAAKAATERARARAQRPPSEGNEEVRQKYARQAIEDESELLAATRSGRRNDQLNISAMKLGQLVGAGYLNRTEVESALESACHANKYIQEHNRKKFLDSLKSGLDKGCSEPRDMSDVGVHGHSEYVTEGVRSRIKSENLGEIEGDFWLRRESLEIIYQAAMAGLLSPWALLGCCAAKALALCPPTVRLPALVGTGLGSLNWFCILAGNSGFGKTVTMDTVNALIKSTVLQRNIGSGEGMIDAYKRPRDKDVEDDQGGVHESIMFIADEIDTLAANKARSGSTTLSTLRSAFSGAMLGASTKASNHFHLEAQSYRMTMIVGAQPGRVGVLADDADAGTPQRFMWFPVLDDRVEEDKPMTPADLTVPIAVASSPNEQASALWAYGGELRVPDVVERTVVRNRVNVMKGYGSEVDSHKLFVREKFAYALAILAGRDKMNEEDWELSGVAMKVSDYTRDWVMSAREEVEEIEAEKLGRTSGMVAAAAEQTKNTMAEKSVNRVAGVLLKHIKSAGREGISQGELNVKLPSRDRGLLVPALTRLENSDLSMKLDRKWLPFDATTKKAHDDEDF